MNSLKKVQFICIFYPKINIMYVRIYATFILALDGGFFINSLWEARVNLDPDGDVHVLLPGAPGHLGLGVRAGLRVVEGLQVGRLRADGILPGQPHGPVGEQSDKLSSEAGQPEHKTII